MASTPDLGPAQDVLRGLHERALADDEEAKGIVRAGGPAAFRAAASRFVLPIGPDVGRFLHLLVRCLGATRILEVGGSMGYSTIWLALAARHTGGTVTSIESDAGKVAQQRENLARAGMADRVRQVPAPSDAVLPTLPGPFDLVLLDHRKELYVRDFNLVWPKVRQGGVVVADNILNPPFSAADAARYVDHVRSCPGANSFTLPLGDGIEVTRRD